MKRVDQLIGGETFLIDEIACHSSAQLIRAFKGDQVTGPWAKFSIETRLLFKLSFIAICHQINWDFLQSRLATNLLVDDGNALISIIANATASDVERWLSGYEKPERIRAAERAGMLRNVGMLIDADLKNSAISLFTTSKGFISGPDGFLKQLDRFDSYREDPLRKKSHVLLQELTREGILNFKDEDTIKPAIDYHIMRLYLRTGRVVPIGKEIKDQLKGTPNPRPRLVHQLREKVGMALDLTALYAGLPVSEVNFIEWQLGRAVCKVDAPGCMSHERDPALDETVARLFDGACPYTSFCYAYTEPEWRTLQEPELKKSFY